MTFLFIRGLGKTHRHQHTKSGPRRQRVCSDREEVKKDNAGNTTEYYNYDPDALDPNFSVDSTSYTRQLSPPDVIALVIFAVVFLVGMPGNILVVWVTGSESRHNINAIWFFNLAVADLLSCLSLPTLFMTIIRNNQWVFGDYACNILPSLLLFNLYASILLLATISAYRFLLVVNPIWYQNYRRASWAWIACSVTWILALMLSIPSFIYRRVKEYHHPSKKICGIDYGLDNVHKEKAVAFLRLVVGFLGPLLTLSVCYTFLLIRAWSRSTTRSSKTLKVVVAVVISFFVFWLPYQVTGMILALFHPSTSVFQDAKYLDALCISIAYINCCINPIIYIVAAQGFHIRFLRTLPTQMRKVLTEESLVRESKSFTLTTEDAPSQKTQAV